MSRAAAAWLRYLAGLANGEAQKALIGQRFGKGVGGAVGAQGTAAPAGLTTMTLLQYARLAAANAHQAVQIERMIAILHELQRRVR